MKEDKKIPLIGEQQIVEFLVDNPHFFVHHPYLLSELNLPQKNGKIVPISHKQVLMLREEIAALKERQAELEEKIGSLIAVVKDNEALSICLHRLALKLIAADEVEAIVRRTLSTLKRQFPANQILIHLFAPWCDLSSTAVALDEKDPVLNRLLISLFDSGKADCGPFGGAVKKALFGNFAQRIRSAIVMPLYTKNNKLGLLLFGSPRTDSFIPGKSTMILVQCAELIATALETCVAKQNPQGRC